MLYVRLLVSSFIHCIAIYRYDVADEMITEICNTIVIKVNIFHEMESIAYVKSDCIARQNQRDFMLRKRYTFQMNSTTLSI